MAESATTGDAPPRRGVLLVEDEAMVAAMVEDMLDELGFAVVATAGRMDEAVELAGSAEIALAVLDVNLGGQATFPVAQALRARGIPFVFATGYGASGIDEAFADVPTLPKPFGGEDLARALRLILTDEGEAGPSGAEKGRSR